MYYLCIVCIFFAELFLLTDLNLASFLWDIVKQNSPRCDAAESVGVAGPSGAILIAYMNFIIK